MLGKLNHTVQTLLRLAFFTQHSFLESDPSYVYQLLFLFVFEYR